jgi:hypothetical protein
MKLFIALFLAIPNFAFSAEPVPTLPIEPVYAADQSIITSLSMQEELNQFRSIGQWQTAVNHLEATQHKYEKAKRDFERAKLLREAGTITEVAFSQVFYEFRVQQGEMIRLPSEVIKNRVTAQFYMLRVLEEGNPGVDHRANLSQTVIDGVEAEIKLLNSAREVAVTANDLAQTSLSQGQILFAKKELSQAELEKRALIAQSASIQMREVTQQINLTKMALLGASKSKSRLAAGSAAQNSAPTP